MKDGNDQENGIEKYNLEKLYSMLAKNFNALGLK